MRAFDLSLKKFVPEAENIFRVFVNSYHQKYRLQSHPWLVETIGLTSGESLRSSPLAAKLNGYIAGAGSIEQFDQEVANFNLNEKTIQYLRKHVIENQGAGLYC